MTKVDWHPYPEETPRYYGDYLITYTVPIKSSKNRAEITYFDRWTDSNCWDVFKDKKVIAWAELPDPYDPETKETDDANS